MFDLLHEAVSQGQEILLKYYRTQLLDISQKTDHQNIVTRADKESQQIIQETILRLMKEKGETDVGFIGEEDLYHTGRHMFVIDPLDGTSNFASGIDYFCIPIAYFRDGELVAGIISRPTVQDLYYAEKGKGAFILRQGTKIPLKVTPGDLKNKVLSIYPEDIALLLEPQRKRIEKMFPVFRSVRSLGAAALDIVGVAENIYGASLLTESPHIWDIAASKII
ncbi:inositol monophosphatase, partial [Candidatus Woesebacteria bacterium]|nr:inositol monophosphatase [Candidatus Woesebacteria bacterium]